MATYLTANKQAAIVDGIMGARDRENFEEMLAEIAAAIAAAQTDAGAAAATALADDVDDAVTTAVAAAVTTAVAAAVDGLEMDAIADLSESTDITAVPETFVDEAAVRTYLAGANVIPNIEARLDAIEAKLNTLLAALRTAGLLAEAA